MSVDYNTVLVPEWDSAVETIYVALNLNHALCHSTEKLGADFPLSRTSSTCSSTQ